ncbi:hypothetical protein [Rubripirellula reticaptiva]|uniref:hypothetical protein n=1 Tax=Rubripirellula reticaptiva TaxID=2528013 RepID=UPI0011B472D5|nr:hypothetical protein [Rubripirellula reticaptiva]
MSAKFSGCGKLGPPKWCGLSFRLVFTGSSVHYLATGYDIPLTLPASVENGVIHGNNWIMRASLACLEC